MPLPFADRPIPILKPSTLPTAGRARVPIELADPRAGERLVDVRDFGLRGDNYYARTDGRNPPYNQPVEYAIQGLLVRESVASLVAKANASLAPAGLALYVFDGYRPIAAQRGLWQQCWDSIARRDPSLSEAEIEKEMLTYWSDPRGFSRDDPRTWPLHSTGGAIDLTLCDASGALFDLGTHFDDMTELAATAWFEEASLRGEIAPDDPRLLARRTLYWTMRKAGFTNYINEWWHYDWGDQLYVFTLDLMGEPLQSGAAWYGYTESDAA